MDYPVYGPTVGFVSHYNVTIAQCRGISQLVTPRRYLWNYVLAPRPHKLTILVCRTCVMDYRYHIAMVSGSIYGVRNA